MSNLNGLGFTMPNPIIIGPNLPGGAVGGIGSAPGGGGISPGEKVAGIGSGISDVAGFVTLLASPALWIRLGEAVAGAVLVIVGVILLAVNTKPGQAAASALPLAAL